MDEARENAGQESAHCDNVMAHLPHIKSTMAAGIIARTMIWGKVMKTDPFKVFTKEGQELAVIIS